jgi:pimeloyl-ACP methyl ester carboxylesterase/DNA-binding CsgD family transcriptional regulator
MTTHPVQYLESFDGTKIAYAVSGSGPPVVLLPSWLTHLHYQDRSVAWRPWLEALTDRYTLIRYDPRGCGLSDRAVDDLTFDAWVRDLDALAQTLDLPRHSLIGACQGGAVALEYAARLPGRVDRLILYGTYARGRDRRGDIPLEAEKANVMRQMIRLGWGADDHAFATAFAKQFQPGGSGEHLRSWCELQRMAATPETALRLTEVMFNIDIRSAAAIIGCPTLVAHAERDAVVPPEEGRLLASIIPHARFLSLDSANHFMLPEEPAWAQFVAALHEFLPTPDPATGRFAGLTNRERDVLHNLAQGLDNHEIAASLGLGEKTIRNHVSAIFDKLDLHSRAKVVVAAREAGFGQDVSAR